MAGVANRKKPRVAWSGELHRKFVQVVEHLGIDRADPKKILEIMNVDYLTRETVASHLQKYRHYLKRVTDENKSNPLGDSSERRNLSPAYHDTQFPCLVGSSSNPWQNVASSSSPAYMNGTPLAPSQVNISQLPSFAASTGHIYPMIQNEEQNQMEGIINTDTGPVAGFSEQTAPFNMASNTAPFEMTNGNILYMTQMVNAGSTTSALPNLQADGFFAPMLNGGSISSALPELHADSSVTPTQMVNGGENASATLPMQEGAVDLRALDDQPIYSDPFFVDDTYANMLNQDLTDDAFFSGGC
uniref:Uncharacterized protein n=1 Tax=Avena sativa TaxID=4498 RepID=A0ACD5U1W6_AVESA